MLLALLATLACAEEPAPAAARPPADPPAAQDAPQDAPGAPPPGLQVEDPTLLVGEYGLRFEEQRWTFGGTSGTAWRASFPRDAAVDVVPSEAVVPFSTLLPPGEAPAGCAWAAINGGFYERGPMGLVVSDGEERHGRTDRGGSGILDWGPHPARVVHRDAWTPGAREAVQSIDRLVSDGQSLVKRRPGARAAARSAVVVGRERLWLVVLAADEGTTVVEDGWRLRGTVARGLPLWAFADYLVQTTDAVDALNLDGAISTQLAVGVAGAGPPVRIHGEAGTINAVVVRGPGCPSGSDG